MNSATYYHYKFAIISRTDYPYRTPINSKTDYPYKFAMNSETDYPKRRERFDVLTVVLIISLFWDTALLKYPEDGGGKILRNVG
jgi:hypothetical protein